MKGTIKWLNRRWTVFKNPDAGTWTHHLRRRAGECIVGLGRPPAKINGPVNPGLNAIVRPQKWREGKTAVLKVWLWYADLSVSTTSTNSLILLDPTKPTGKWSMLVANLLIRVRWGIPELGVWTVLGTLWPKLIRSRCFYTWNRCVLLLISGAPFCTNKLCQMFLLL